jgi:hypothetical protein
MPRLHRGSPLPASAPGSLFQPCHDCTGTRSCTHLHRDWAHPCHICIGTGRTPATSASEPPFYEPPFYAVKPNHALLCSLECGRAVLYTMFVQCAACHICTGTGLTPTTSERDWAHPHHICTGTGLTLTTSAPGLGSSPPHLHRDWAHPHHICTGTGLTGAGAVRSGATCSASLQRIRTTV